MQTNTPAPTDSCHDWPHPAFAHPAFAPSRQLLMGFRQFPDHGDWAAIPPPAQTGDQQAVRFVHPDSIDRYYELAIAETGQVATRPDSWHDCFNAAIWHTFPQSKLAMNRLHCREMANALYNARGPVRDAATLLDECGLLIASSDPTLLDALRKRDWQQLFAPGRWGHDIQAYVIGHATLEYLLAPFPGLTGKCVPIMAPPRFFELELLTQIAKLDACLADALDADWLQSPRQLPVLPWLGIPGWWPEQDAAFYADRTHFCPPRTDKPHGDALSTKNALTLALD
ncbi:DUF3025 domain-containing protein [Chitinilyticum litopenaei]|uniref:DUF3025 domain-containing protein n=1 Tax=Chitinilyticum litopenaei TaxID=1121276 RepID=UPI001185EEFC|nr:DUF3025 domain-containing protein [Chitinilyticum litopenaei]